MQNLYFVRHGQTELNAANRVQGGAIDSPLLEKSRKAAEKTGIFLKKKAIAKVITSPQIRAKETAELIVSQFELPFDMETDESLKEFGYGEWEGRFIPEIEEQYQQLFYNLRHAPHHYDPTSFGGETYTQLIERGTKAILYHAEKNPNSDLLFVGHSITLTAAILTLAGYPLKEIRSQTPMANTAISQLVKSGRKIALASWNKTDHLK